jgi:hypothetical protein
MIQLENRWTDLDEIWYGRYTTEDHPKIASYNLLQSNEQINELVR